MAHLKYEVGFGHLQFPSTYFGVDLNKSLVGLHHYVVGHGNEVAADVDDAVAPLVVAVGVRALLSPTATLVDCPIAANQEAVANVIISLLIFFRK